MDLAALLNFRSPWFWVIVVGGGALLAFVILPRITGGALGLGSPSTSQSSGPGQETSAGTSSANPQPIYVVDETQYTPPGGIQGAVPPVTNVTSNQTTQPNDTPTATTATSPATPPSTPVPTPTPPPTPTPTPPPAVTPPPVPSQQPMQPPKQFIHPSAWPAPLSTLSGIAQQYGQPLSALESFPENQYIRQRSPQGWDLIYTSDTIRVS